MTKKLNQKTPLEKKIAISVRKLKQSLVEQNWENSLNICEQLITVCSEQLIEINPEKVNPDKYTILGDSLLDKGHVAGALACYNYATDLKDKLAHFYKKLGLKSLEKKDFDQALFYFLKALENQPNSAENNSNLATIYANLQQWEEAIKYYKKALNLNPKLAPIYRNLARLFLKLGQETEANNYLYEAYILEPESVSAEEYYNLGKFFFTIKEQEKALFCCQQAVKLKEDYDLALDILGQIFVAQNNLPKAINVYQKLGIIFFKKQKYSYSIKAYKRAIDYSKTLGTVQANLVDLFGQVVRANPKSSAELYFEFAQLLRSKGRFDEAIDMYIKTLELDPKLRGAYVNLQYTPTENNKLDQLIEFYQKQVKLEPKITFLWQNLGDVLTQKGQLSEAITCYQQACNEYTIQVKPHLAKINYQGKKEQGPDFLIIGTAKGGTSSLHTYLSTHPQILLPLRKEIGFFNRYYDYGVEWYLSQFPPLTDQYGYLTGESTTAYLQHCSSESRVYQLFPEVKLIVLLRHPVEQLISWHYHKVNTGLYQKTLQQAIKDDLVSIDHLSEQQIGEILNRRKYGLMGCLYYYHLKRWFDYFPREQFLILKSEDFFADPDQTLQEVYQFLGLPEHHLKDYPKSNVGYYPEITQEMRKFLTDYCLPHTRKLEELLGREFNWF